MKYLTFATLSLVSVFAAAAPPAGPTPAVPAPVTVQYDYSQHLDVAKVVSITADNPEACGITNAHMVYLDSQGVTHNLEYTRMGNGCENG